MTTTETPMQSIERAERDALRIAREDPMERRNREAAEREQLAGALRSEEVQRLDAEREAAAAADATAQAERAEREQLALDTADEMRIQTVLALYAVITSSEATLRPRIDKGQQALDKAIADGAGPEVLFTRWLDLREASAELWTTTTEGRRMIALTKGDPVTGTAPGDPLTSLTFNDVCERALVARCAAPTAAATARVAAAYSDASATVTKRANK